LAAHVDNFLSLIRQYEGSIDKRRFFGGGMPDVQY